MCGCLVVLQTNSLVELLKVVGGSAAFYHQEKNGTCMVHLSLVQSVYFGKDVFYMKMDDVRTALADVVLSALHRAAIAAIIWSCLETGAMLLAGFTFSYC